MNWSRFKHDTLNEALGTSRKVTLLGTVITAGYTLGVLLVPQPGVNVPFYPYLGPFIGGFVAGAYRGTNVYDGVMYGYRAAAYGMAVIALVAAVGSFILFMQATGDHYFFVSSFIGLMVIIFFVPVMGLAGAFAGPVGTLVRRTALPARYNPPVR